MKSPAQTCASAARQMKLFFSVFQLRPVPQQTNNMAKRKFTSPEATVQNPTCVSLNFLNSRHTLDQEEYNTLPPFLRRVRHVTKKHIHPCPWSVVPHLLSHIFRFIRPPTWFAQTKTTTHHSLSDWLSVLFRSCLGAWPGSITYTWPAVS